jgi:uncharacterized protein (UPF0147 family)
MKDFKELDKKLEKIESDMRYMKQVINDNNKPDELKKIARETLIELGKEKQKILEEIRK